MWNQNLDIISNLRHVLYVGYYKAVVRLTDLCPNVKTDMQQGLPKRRG